MNDSDSKENGNNIDVTLLGPSSKNKKNSDIFSKKSFS